MRILNKALNVVVVLAIVLVVLAAVGWIASFLIEFELAAPADTDLDYFVVRIFLGVFLLGIMNGAYMLFDLCVYIAKDTGE